MLILAAGGGRSEPDMSEELFAISKIPPAPAAQGDYDSICAALMHTERGRWFLQEYARRNRSADTQLLLAAIQRIEAVVCAERNKQAQQGFRSDLLEMAKAITRTRAEVAELKTDALHAAESVRPDTRTPPPPKTRDVFAAAERIRDVTWAMRGHGFDPSTCDQLEELAGTILSASSLRDPTDHRASKLSEVLQYLEHRIDTLLESSQDGDATASEPAPAPDPAAFEPEPLGDAGPTNGLVGSLVSAEPELTAGDVETSSASPPSRPNNFYDVSPPLAADAGLESEAEAEAVVEAVVEAKVETEAGADTETAATASSPATDVEMAAEAVVAPEPQSENSLELESEPLAAIFPDPEPCDTPPPGAGAPATDAGRPPPTSEAAEGPPEPLIATQDQEVETQAASETASAPRGPAGGVESPFTDLVAAAPVPADEDRACGRGEHRARRCRGTPRRLFGPSRIAGGRDRDRGRERTAMVAIARGWHRAWHRRAAGRAVAVRRAERCGSAADGAIADPGTDVSSRDRSARGIAGLRHGSGERSAAGRHASTGSPASAGSPATAGSPGGTARARKAGPRAGTGL